MKRLICMTVIAMSAATGTARAQGQTAVAPIAVWPSADGNYELPPQDQQRTADCDLPQGLVRSGGRIRIDRPADAAWRSESIALPMVTDTAGCDAGPTLLVTFLPATLTRAQAAHRITWSPMAPESVSVHVESALFSDRIVREAHVLRLVTREGLVSLAASRCDGTGCEYSGQLLTQQRDALLANAHPQLRADVALVDQLPAGTRLVRGGMELHATHALFELSWQAPAAPWSARVDLARGGGDIQTNFSWAAAIIAPISAMTQGTEPESVLDSLRGSSPAGWRLEGLDPEITDVVLEMSTVLGGTGKIWVSVGREVPMSFNVVAEDRGRQWRVASLPRVRLCARRATGTGWTARSTLLLDKDVPLPRVVPVHVTTTHRCSADDIRPGSVTVHATAAVGSNARTSQHIQLDVASDDSEHLQVWVTGANQLRAGTVIRWRGRSVAGQWGACAGTSCPYELHVPGGVGDASDIPLEFSVAGLASGVAVYDASGRSVESSYTVVATSWRVPTGLRRLVPLQSAAPSSRFGVGFHPAFRFLTDDHDFTCKLAGSWTSCGTISRTGPSSVAFQLTNEVARSLLSASAQRLEVKVLRVGEFEGRELPLVLFTEECNFEFVQRTPLISGVNGGQIWIEVTADSTSCLDTPLALASAATLKLGVTEWRESRDGSGRPRRFLSVDVLEVTIPSGGSMEAAVSFSNGTRADGVGASQASARLAIRPALRWSDVGLDVEVPASPGATDPGLLRNAEYLGLRRRNFLRVPRQDGVPWRVFVLDYGVFEPCASNWETEAYDAPANPRVYPASTNNDDELTGRLVANGPPAYCFQPRHRASDNKLRMELRLEAPLRDFVTLDADWPAEIRSARVRVGSRRLEPTKEARTYLFPTELTSGVLFCGEHRDEHDARIESGESPVPLRAREFGSCELRFPLPAGACGSNGIVTTASPQALRLRLHVRPGSGQPKAATLRDLVIGAGHSVPDVSCEDDQAVVHLGPVLDRATGVEVSGYDEVSIELRHLSEGERTGGLQSSRTFMPDEYAAAAATRLEFRTRYAPNSNLVFPFRRGENRSNYGIRMFISLHAGLGMARVPHSGRDSTMSSDLDGAEQLEFDYGIVLAGEFWDFGANDAPWSVLNPQLHVGLLLPKSDSPATDVSIVVGLGLRFPVANPPGQSAVPFQLLPTLWYELSWVDGHPFHAMVFGVRLTAGMVLGN